MCTMLSLCLFSNGPAVLPRPASHLWLHEAMLTCSSWSCIPWIPSKLLYPPPCMTLAHLMTVHHGSTA